MSDTIEQRNRCNDLDAEASRDLADFLEGRANFGGDTFSYDRLHGQLVWGVLDQKYVQGWR